MTNFFIKVAKGVEGKFFEATIDTFEEVDLAFSENLQKYMCKKECPCDPKGLERLSRWSPYQITKMRDSGEYMFNGWYTNFFDCYQDLLKIDDFIKEKDRISSKSMLFIQDFENNLKCAGMCKVPDFWFYQDFFNGPPVNNCLTSLKEEFDKADGLLGYSFVAMAGAILL
jgi:hypothetical protein